MYTPDLCYDPSPRSRNKSTHEVTKCRQCAYYSPLSFLKHVSAISHFRSQVLCDCLIRFSQFIFLCPHLFFPYIKCKVILGLNPHGAEVYRKV
jgi:hypothetical protein